MRQIGTLAAQADAERFAAYLITTGVVAHAEDDTGDWVIWVRDENQVDEAKHALGEFQQDPRHPRYDGVERLAQERLQGEQREREEARKNVIDIRRRWKGAGPSARRRPLVITCIVLSIVVYLLTNGASDLENSVVRQLLFIDPVPLIEGSFAPDSVADRMVNIRAGEIWRLVTPIFIHFSAMHIAFNMIMFYQLGSVVEDRRGTGWMLAFVLGCAAVSNLVQCTLPPAWDGGLIAGGMSGVLYGLFGYSWMKSRFQPELGIYINPGTVVVLLGWMLLGMSGIMEQSFGISMANWAHGIGFAFGIVVGYAPLLLPSSPGS